VSEKNNPVTTIREVTVSPTYSPPYSVIIGREIVSEAPHLIESKLRTNIDKVVILVQESTLNLRPTRILLDSLSHYWETHVVDVPDGEQAKSLNVALSLIEFLHKVNATKSTLIVAVGGGALGDVAGFVASVYLRGLKLVLVPTTLLSMVDSAIGGKNAINMFNVKNVVGTIYQPSLVIEDLAYLDTLPLREFSSGLAEVVKYGVTINPRIISMLDEQYSKILSRDTEALLDLVEMSVRCKAWIVRLDEREERDVRQVLNYGHTVGHAVEACAAGKLTHGECVMIGMIVESDLGVELELTHPEVHQTVARLAPRLSLPSKIPRDISINDLIGKIRHDKKRYGNVIKLPVVKHLGEFEIVPLELDKFEQVLRKVVQRHIE